MGEGSGCLFWAVRPGRVSRGVSSPLPGPTPPGIRGSGLQKLRGPPLPSPKDGGLGGQQVPSAALGWGLPLHIRLQPSSPAPSTGNVQEQSPLRVGWVPSNPWERLPPHKGPSQGGPLAFDQQVVNPATSVGSCGGWFQVEEWVLRASTCQGCSTHSPLGALGSPGPGSAWAAAGLG